MKISGIAPSTFSALVVLALCAIINSTAVAQGMRMSAEDRAKQLKEQLSLNDR